jgi:hypothetical protein
MVGPPGWVQVYKRFPSGRRAQRTEFFRLVQIVLFLRGETCCRLLASDL